MRMTNINMQLMLVGRVMTDGRLNARLKADLSDKLILKANAQVSAATGECVCSMVYLEYCIYHPFFFFFSSWQVSHICHMRSSTLTTWWGTSFCLKFSYPFGSSWVSSSHVCVGKRLQSPTSTWEQCSSWSNLYSGKVDYCPPCNFFLMKSNSR